MYWKVDYMSTDGLKELYSTPPSHAPSGGKAIVISGTLVKHPEAKFHSERTGSLMCKKERPQSCFMCTRPKGHTGVHEAHTTDGKACGIGTWE